MTTPADLYVRWSAVSSAVVQAYSLVALVYWVVDADLTPLQLVLLGTALEISVLTAEIPTGVMADTFSRKWSIVVSHLMMGAGFAATGLTTAFVPLLLTQMFWGVGFTFRSGADVAWITDELKDPNRIDALLARAARWTQMGRIIGVVAGGAMAWQVGRPSALVVSGSVMMAIGVAVAVFFPEHEFERARSGHFQESLGILRSGLQLARVDKQILLVLTTVLLFNSGAEAVDRLWVKRLVDLGFPQEPDPVVWFAVLAVVAALTGMVGLRIVELRIGNRSTPRSIYAAAIGLAAVGTIVLALAPNLTTGLVGAFAIHGMAWPVIPVVASTWINRRATSNVRATVQSFLGQAESVGEITGGVALGALAEASSIPTSLVFSAALFVLAGLVVHRSRAGREPVPA